MEPEKVGPFSLILLMIESRLEKRFEFQLVFERDRAKRVVAASRRRETTRWQVTGQRYPRVEESDILSSSSAPTRST